MKGYAILWLVFAAINLGLNIALHGQIKTKEYNVFVAVFLTLVIGGAYYYLGMFD